MKILIPYYIAVGLVCSLLGIRLGAQAQTMPQSNDKPGRSVRMEGTTGGATFDVSLTTDKGIYTTGEPVTVVFRVVNKTQEAVTFHFTTSQRFDVSIQDAKGNEQWRWSAGRMFAQMVGTETIGPGHPPLEYTTQVKARLEPGSYTLTGTLAARDRPLSASVIISVKYRDCSNDTGIGSGAVVEGRALSLISPSTDFLRHEPRPVVKPLKPCITYTLDENNPVVMLQSRSVGHLLADLHADA